MSDEPKPKELTGKQKKFVAAYVMCLNASEAARIAGYANGSAAVTGHDNLRKPNIKAAIDAIFAEQGMGSDEVTARLSAQARADIADIIDPATGTLDWAKAMDGGHTHLIKKWKQRTIIRMDKNGDEEEEHIFEIQLHDAQAALVHIGKVLGMFVTRTELSGPNGGAIPIDDGLSETERAARLMAFVDAARKARSGRDSGG